MRIFLKACCCLFLFTGIAIAQSDRGTITGSITDPAGAIIPSATIQAKNNATSAEYVGASTNTGNYTLAQLPPGVYQITVSKNGFKTFVRQGITIQAAQIVRIDVSLEVGAISETVTVTEDAPLIKTETGELSHNVRTDTLDNLPILSIGGGAGANSGIRNPYSVMNVLPGVDWRPDLSVRVNGTPGNTQAMRVEGMDTTNNMWQNMAQYTQQGVDAIQEFAVQTSNYAAEFGQAGSAVFNLTMRSGTNQLHGSAYEYFVNEALNASTPNYSRNNSPDKLRPRSRRNDYGFTFGGPVYIPKVFDGRDKAFFFFTFEQYREATTASTAITVPTLAMRNGDFSAIKGTTALGKDILNRDIFENTIYDWRTERQVNGVAVWDPFQNNQIPSTLWDSAAVKIMSYMPNPDASKTDRDFTLNYTNRTSSERIAYIPSVKLDYALSNRAKISGYWSRNYTQTTPTDGMPTQITAAVPTNFPSTTIRINFDYTLKPTMLMHLGVGTMHNVLNQTPPKVDVRGIFGIANAFDEFPTFSAATMSSGTWGGFSPMLGNSMSGQLDNWKPTANISLNWIKGNHSYKFGGELIVESHASRGRTFANTYYYFSPNQTADPSLYIRGQALPAGKSIGFAFAGFLAGRVDNLQTNTTSRGHLGNHALAFYAQDTWKITPKLTLDYGLRYDFQTYLREQYGRWGSFDPTIPNPSADGLPGGMKFEANGPAFAKNYKFAFGPRIGLAYQFMPKTVLRIGAGISYARTPELGYLHNTLSNFVASASSTRGAANSQLKDGAPSVVWPDFRPGAFPRLPSLSPPPVAIDHNAGRPPRIIQWSVGIQREVVRNIALEVSYIGNRGVWWQAGPLIDINSITPEYLKTKYNLDISNPADRQLLTTPLLTVRAKGPEYAARFPIPFTNFPIGTTLYPGASLLQAIRPIPQFTGINFVWAPLGKTWYDSLQLKLTKRFSHNLDVIYSFTYQKEMTLGAETSYNLFATVTPQINDVTKRNSNKYISGLSRPFMNVIAISYTTPRAFGFNRPLSLIARDWQIGAVLRYTSAQPIRVPAAATPNVSTYLARNAATFANRVPGVPLFQDQNGKAVDINGDFDPATTFVLNPAAWTNPSTDQFSTSTAYYNDYRGRRHPTENMSLARNFKFGKEGRMNLQLRAEFNNIFNRLYVPDPTSTSAAATQTYVPNTSFTSGGFGYINMQSATVASGVRSGQIVARFNF
jgi:hypothetical protein